jgi:hypothetical protein
VLQDLNRDYFRRPQLVAELPNQLSPALLKLSKVGLKVPDEGASRTIGRKLPVLFAAKIQSD